MYNVRELKTGIRRLMVLRDHLKNNVKDKKFDLDSWVDNEESRTDQGIVKDLADASCGTTACALGHAGSIPSFRRAGLRYDVRWYVAAVSYGINKGFDAGQEFFHLTEEESFYLFDPDKYPEGKRSKGYVIKHIDKQIKNMEKKIAVIKAKK